MISGLPTNVPNTCEYGHVDVRCWNTIFKRQTLPRKVYDNNHLLCRTRLRGVRALYSKRIVNFTQNLKSAVFYRQITIFGTSTRYNTVRDTAGVSVMYGQIGFSTARDLNAESVTLRNEKSNECTRTKNEFGRYVFRLLRAAKELYTHHIVHLTRVM